MGPRILAPVVLGLIAILSPLAGTAAAQEIPPPAVEFEAGWLGFADDGIVNESMIGGTFRWYARPRISIGPEVIYINGDGHRHLVVTGNITYDLLSPMNGGARPVTPFVVAGGGLFQTRESFPSGEFTSTEGAFTAGGGVRASAGDRVTFGIDARVGWELHVRVNGFVGVRLGR